MVPPVLRSRGLPALLAMIVLGAIAAAGNFSRLPAAEARRVDAARLMNDLMSGKVPVGGPFTLTDQRGGRTALADFRGKLVLLYFGYIYCPNVCPTDLLTIAETIKSLGARGDDLQPVFVTLDPERDTREVLEGYVRSFHPRFVALTGQVEEIRRIATAYKVFFEKVKPAGSAPYLIDHSAFTFLLDRNGRYVGVFPPGTTVERMSAALVDLL